MRVLGSVVLTQTLLMGRGVGQLASCCPIGTQLVGHELVWRIALLLEQLAPLCCTDRLMGQLELRDGVAQEGGPLLTSDAPPCPSS